MLLQLHLHSPLNTWLQWIGHWQLEDEVRNFEVLWFDVPYIRGLTVIDTFCVWMVSKWCEKNIIVTLTSSECHGISNHQELDFIPQLIQADNKENIPAFVQLMIYPWTGSKPLPQTMMALIWYINAPLSLNELTQLPLDKTTTILADKICKWIFVNEIVGFQFQFHCNLFPRVQLTINQHWFR